MLMKTEISRLIFEKCSNIKIDENPTSGSRVVTFGRTDTTKLFATLRTRLNVTLRLAAEIKGTLIGGSFHKWSTFPGAKQKSVDTSQLLYK
jgi:hypothetical protein